MKKNIDMKKYLETYVEYYKAKEELMKLKQAVDKIQYPQWIIAKWLRLYSVFSYNRFTQEEAKKVLKIVGIRTILNEMKHAKLLNVVETPRDKRKKYYKLVK